MIPLTCDHCDKKLRLRDELAGRRIKCPGCGGTLTVPLLDDEEVDAPPPKSKAATFTPMKPSRARDDDEDDDEEEEEDRVRRKKKRPDNAGKPSPLLLIVGLILGIGGLVAMSACIVFAKQANDKANELIGDKEHLLKQRQMDLELAVNDLHRKNLRKDIEKLESDIDDVSHDEVTRYALFAVGCGVVFLAGFGIRGYHHVAMKRWHAEIHGTGKNRKRRDEDDDEDDDE